MTGIPAARRPLKSRQSLWAKRAAAWLAARRVPPNGISLAAIACAGAAGACMLAAADASAATRIVLYTAAAAFIQLRLVCNLLDGMVAVEGGLKTSSGEIFNDLPDRIADPLILIAAGYAIGSRPGPDLGWVAALLAVLTAYVRVLGAAAGLPHDFRGPMAKPQRMAVMTMACLAAMAEPRLLPHGATFTAALGIVAAGSALTVIVRTRVIVAALERR